MGEAKSEAHAPDTAPVAVIAGRFTRLCGWCGGLILLQHEEKKAEHHGYKPGPSVPAEIAKGLIEIEAALRDRRNPKGAMALCLDVLDMILAHGRAKWPHRKSGKNSDALSGGAEAAVSIIISAATSLVLTLATGPGWGRVIGARLCSACAVQGYSTVGVTVLALAGLFAGALLSLVLLRLAREQLPALIAKADEEPPSRTDLLNDLREEGVITKALLTLGLSIGINAPKRPKPGGPPPKPTFPPPAPPTQAGVSSVGSFVLALADQLFETPRRVEEARIGNATGVVGGGAGEGHGHGETDSHH